VIIAHWRRIAQAGAGEKADLVTVGNYEERSRSRSRHVDMMQLPGFLSASDGPLLYFQVK
jgi:hypothetical protein